MKAIPFKIPRDEYRSIRVQVDEGDHFYDKLHYHPELQITVILKSSGIIYGGNNMLQFKEGDIFVFGANIPHLFKNDPIYYTDNSPGVLSHTLFFDQQSFGDQFFKMKELINLSRFLEQSRRGIIVQDEALRRMISSVLDEKNETLIINVLQILVLLMRAEKKYINSEYYQLSLDERVGQRLNDILDFTFTNMANKISIKEVASIANLSESQFSRYFKTHTGKSYIQFLNEIRVETACNLLLEESVSIGNVCYAVGFQNVSNFNRKFKSLKGLTPRAYRQKMKG